MKNENARIFEERGVRHLELSWEGGSRKRFLFGYVPGGNGVMVSMDGFYPLSERHPRPPRNTPPLYGGDIPLNLLGDLRDFLFEVTDIEPSDNAVPLRKLRNSWPLAHRAILPGDIEFFVWHDLPLHITESWHDVSPEIMFVFSRSTGSGGFFATAMPKAGESLAAQLPAAILPRENIPALRNFLGPWVAKVDRRENSA